MCLFQMDNNLHTLAVVLYKLSDNTIECFEPFVVGIIRYNFKLMNNREVLFEIIRYNFYESEIIMLSIVI
jgi:hypothetical protein